MILKCIILIFLYSSSNGQLLETLGNSFLQTVNTITGEAISSVVRATSAGSMSSTRAVGRIGSFPTVRNHNNLVDTANFLPQFQAGLQNEDADLPIMALVKKYGYPIEEHLVTTEDGYILTLHRIKGNGSTLFLMHGLLGSSDDFVLAGPESSLAYFLANKGFDLWLGNARGNKHSRRHVSMTPSEGIFWDFSWHEIGYYDLPAMIDYTLDYTGEKTVKYIGHSQGTTAFFVMASERPEYNEKISLMIAMSPVAWMTHVKSPLAHFMAPSGPAIHAVSKAIGIYEFLPEDNFIKTLKTNICGVGAFADVICGNILFTLAGFDYAQLNVTNLPVIFGHIPSGSSVKQFAHYGQLVMSGDFRYYDNGPVRNIRKYGSEVPPSYRVDRITVPVCLFYSESDWLAQPEDVHTLYNKLPNVLDVYKVPYSKFNHIDFIWAKDIKRLIFRRLLFLINF